MLRCRHLILVLVAVFFCGASSCADPPELLGIIPSDTTGTLFGEAIIPMGDQNGDGYNDFLISRGNRVVYLFLGGDTVNTERAMRFDSVTNEITPLSDINGDGAMEFAVGSYSRVKNVVYFGGPSIDNQFDMVFGLDTLFMSHARTSICSVDPDGLPEIWGQSIQIPPRVLSYDYYLGADTSHVWSLTPANLTWLVDYETWGRQTTSIDLDADGYDDLAVTLDGDVQMDVSGSVYIYYGGPGFDTIPDLIIDRPGGYIDGAERFGWVLSNIGDIDGDGDEDLLISSDMSSADTVSFIYCGGSDADTIPDYILTQHFTIAKNALDLNGDTYSDLLVGHPVPFAVNLMHVSIYFGGPAFDTIPDVTLRPSNVPFYVNTNMGLDVAGIGDYNGDGINDFAFSYGYSSLDYRIAIYSGWGDPTDVDYEYEPTLPDNIALHQNYPNPFNPTTTIEFELSQNSHARLTVHNILGQQVALLIDKQLQVGTHRVTWDGKLDSGETAPSGVYLYTLETDEQTLSRKMLLVK